MVTINNQNVNFIPEEVINAKKQKVHLSFSLMASIIFFVVASITWGGIYYFNLLKSKEISNLENQIASQRSIINNLKELGEKGYQLGVRLEAAKDILDNKSLYTKLLTELNSKVPDTVAITDVAISGTDTVVINGEALSNYAPVGEYTERLLENKDMFADVKIASAQGVGQKDLVKFTINIKLKKGGLNESIK